MNATEKKVIGKMLEETILEAVPKAVAREKYGGLLYTLKPEEKEGQFCGVFAYKNHVQLAIGFGPELDDPEKVLKGTGKTRRHVNFSSADEVHADVLVPLLQQAAKLSSRDQTGD